MKSNSEAGVFRKQGEKVPEAGVFRAEKQRET